MTDVIVTNFNRNFTGVSATTAGVLHAQAKGLDVALCGYPLPGCPAPITLRQARAASRRPVRRHVIWHVRRNTEMRAALWARDVLRLPIRIVFTSAAQRRHSAFPRWLISRMDAVIATSAAAAGFVPHIRDIIPHGVDTERFFPAASRAEAWVPTGYPGSFGIATIGRIRPEKGTDRFVEAMLHLLPLHPEATALVIGRASSSDTAFLHGLKDQTVMAQLQDRILFPGEIAPDALPALLRGLGAVVQLPRYEGYGMAPLEGMASGVPFVASDAGAYRQFAGKGRAGLIVDPDLAEGVADTLSALINDPERRAKMALNARADAVACFSVEAEAASINAVYNALWAEP